MQGILTPPLGQVLQCLIDEQRRGSDIRSVAPHYASNGELVGYLVIVNVPDAALRLQEK